MKIKNNSIRAFMVLPIYIGLIFTMFINGWNLMSAESPMFLAYLNIYNTTKPLADFPTYFTALFHLIGGMQLGVSLILIYALARKEFLENSSSHMLKWGLLLALFSLVIYGFMVRTTSNHAGAANLYFYLVILYFLLGYIEKQSVNRTSGLFHRLKLLPLYISIFYTMWFPGWQKIAGTPDVVENYVKMFSSSILVKIPGGIEPFIYFLGIMEIIAPIFLVISLVKGELALKKTPKFLNISLIVTITIFIMLCFGLSILGNYPGATNLIFYAILTLALYVYVLNNQKQMDEVS